MALINFQETAGISFTVLNEVQHSYPQPAMDMISRYIGLSGFMACVNVLISRKRSVRLFYYQNVASLSRYIARLSSTETDHLHNKIHIRTPNQNYLSLFEAIEYIHPALNHAARSRTMDAISGS